MKTAATHAKEIESGFLAGVRQKLEAAQGRLIPGKSFKIKDRDNAEGVRATMIDRRLFEQERYAELPHGEGFVIRGYDRRWIFGKRLRSVTTASVLAPPEPLLESDDPASPVTLSELIEHVRDLVTDPKVPHLIGVCSPSGFEEEARKAPPDMGNVMLVLIEPRDDGGWQVTSTAGNLDPRLSKLFDPEQVLHKLDRVRREIEEHSSDLLTGGLTASTMARELEVPVPMVQHAFELAAKADPELQVSKRSGEAMLFRGAPVSSAREDHSMSLAEWIKSLFSKEGEEAKKINVLSERRAALSGRLDRMYEDIAQLEKKEQQLHQEGKATTSKVSKRRIAGQVMRLRKDISRCNTSAAMVSKQINIIGTHIHNLELARTGSVAQLPSSEELTEAAVNAEEILEQLTVGDDLVTGLDVGLAESAMSEEEEAILAEFEAAEPQAAPPQAREKTPESPENSKAPEQREPGQAQAE